MSKLKKTTSPQPRCPSDASRYVVDYMDHAPVWPAVIFAQGLFRPTQNGAPVVPLEIEYETTIQKQRVEYVFRSPEALNIVDQAVFLHLCQLMAAGNRVHLAPDHERYPVYCAALGASGLWSDQGISVVVVKLSDVAHGIGLTRTGTNARSVLASLNRLSQLTVHRQMHGPSHTGEGASRFLAFTCSDTHVRIAISVEAAWFAVRRQGVAWVNMREHRSLKSKPAKRLHAWLSAWASPVERKSIGLDKLLVNVWGGPPAHADARKDRMRTLRQAIKEVGELRGWSCDLSADGKQLLVRKPRFAGTLAQAEQDAQSVSGAHTAATPTAPAGTTPPVATTPTNVVATPTANRQEPAPSAELEGMEFAL